MLNRRKKPTERLFKPIAQDKLPCPTNLEFVSHTSKFSLAFEILFVLILLILACFIRTRNLSLLNERDLLDTDSYRFYRQAQIITSTGGLPSRDMMRWRPIGRDLRQHLNAWSYVLAHSFQRLQVLFPSLTLYRVAVFSSVACFLGALVVFFVMIRRILGPLTALLSLAILSCFSQSDLLFRSCAGFADRDSFCLLIGFFSLYVYLRLIQADQIVSKILWWSQYTWATILLGLAWEGAVVFISAIVLVNVVWLLCYRYRWTDFCLYAGWYVLFATSLLTLTKAYQGGASAFAPFAAVTLGAPPSFLLLAALSFSLRRINNRYVGRHISPEVAVLVGLIGISSLVFVFSSSARDFLALLVANLLNPFGTGRLMQSVAELVPSSLPIWISDYKMMVPILFIGFQMALYYLLRRLAVYPWLVLCSSVVWLLSLFYLDTFLHRPAKGDRLLLMFYFCAACLLGLSLLIEMIRRSWGRDSLQEVTPFKYDGGQWMLLIWFILTLFLAHGARRYHLFFAPVAVCYATIPIAKGFRWIAGDVLGSWWWVLVLGALVGAEMAALGIVPIFLGWGLQTVSILAGGWLLVSHRLPLWKIRIALWGMLITFLIGWTSFWPVLGGYGYESMQTMRRLIPFHSADERAAFDWSRIHLPPSAVIATEWAYGSHINVIAERATVVDEDSYIPYWIYLISRHVFCGQTEEEALEFLKTHEATHLLISERMLSLMPTISFIGSNANNDRLMIYYPLTPLASLSEDQVWRFGFPSLQSIPLSYEGRIYSPNEWQAIELVIPNTSEARIIARAYVRVQIGSKKIELPPEQLDFHGNRIESVHGKKFPGTFILYPKSLDGNSEAIAVQCVYLPPGVPIGLMVKLFLIQPNTTSFQLIYPSTSNPYVALAAPVKIWAINYPPKTKTRPEYMATTFPDSDTSRGWMLNQ